MADIFSFLLEIKGSLLFFRKFASSEQNKSYQYENLTIMKAGHEEPIRLVGGVITVSSTRNRESDTSGRTIISIYEDQNIPLGHYEIVADRIESIQEELASSLATCNFIVLNGGTGLTHDDCTIEAVSPLLEKRIDGFGELFRMKSYDEIGTAAMLSRAIAGIIGGKAVFCIPGSTGAVKLAVESLIIPEIRHILTHANK